MWKIIIVLIFVPLNLIYGELPEPFNTEIECERGMKKFNEEVSKLEEVFKQESKTQHVTVCVNMFAGEPV